MTPTSVHAVPQQALSTQETSGPPPSVWLFVLSIVACGAIVLNYTAVALQHAALNVYVLLLAVLTVASGRFKIKVPGRPLTVSVSEVFVFTSMLLFGPAPATATVAIDGLWISATATNRKLHRTLFNVAEPAISTWTAGTLFFAMAGLPPGGLFHAPSTNLFFPTIAMVAVYFLLNSSLTAVAIALENGGSAFDLWKRHATYLGINYYAAASLAALAVNNASGVNLEVIGLAAPLLILSYAAYKTASSRAEDAQRHVSEVEHLYQSTVETLAIAVDAKDQVTHGHIRRVQRHTLAMAKALGMTDEIELKALEAASLLHDLGKLAIPDYVLNKPGALSRPEYEIMKQHAAIGATILNAVEFPYPVVPIVRHHHEQWNGAGYPDGLSGENIPLGARILTVVDCFDAVTSDRPYRRKLTDAEATEILLARRGTMYDPRAVDAFIEMIPALRREDAAIEASSLAYTAMMTTSVQVERKIGPSGGRTSPGVERLRAIGPTVGSKLERLLPTSEVCLFAHDSETDALVPVFSTLAIRDALSAQLFYVGDALSGWVASSRHTIVNSDPRLDLGQAASRLGLQFCTSTPVMALGTLVGVLTIYSPRDEKFSDKETRVLGAIAQELAIEFVIEGGLDGVPATVSAQRVHENARPTASLPVC